MATPANARSAAVLVIDDQPFFTNMLRNVLEQQGFRVQVAASGPEGFGARQENSRRTPFSWISRCRA